jgi:hypothetical protein
MRGPSSFKSELAAYRRQVIPQIADDDQRRLASKIIDNWKDHAAVETIWNTIKRKLPAEDMPTAEEFIYLVLERRLSWDRVKRNNSETPALVAKFKTQLRRHLREENFSQLERETPLLSKYLEVRDRLLGRKKAAAPQKLFSKEWRDQFRKLCGDPLDEVARVLTEIAFDKPVPISAMRDIDKPTTRRARQSKARPSLAD